MAITEAVGVTAVAEAGGVRAIAAARAVQRKNIDTS
jgi:hypothetical protein